MSFIVAKKAALRQFEEAYIHSLLQKNNGNVHQSARDADLDRSNFLRLCRRLKLTPSLYRKQEAA